MNRHHERNVIVIGSGPEAGHTIAAIYAARANLEAADVRGPRPRGVNILALACS